MKKLWEYSPILTLPIVVLGLIWSVKTADLYHNAKNVFCSPMQYTNLYKMGKIAFHEIKTSALIPFSKSNPLYHIVLPGNSYKAIHSGNPYISGEYQIGSFIDKDQSIKEVKVKTRGDCSYHWLYKKKSYRVKTKKNEAIENRKTWNFNIIKTKYFLSNHYFYSLAKLFGLLAPRSDFVEISVNGEPAGIRLMVEQLDDEFLQNNNLPSGDLYFGENFMTTYFYGVHGDLFSTPQIWEKKTSQNTSNKTIYDFVYKIMQNDFSHLDLDSFVKFSILLDLGRVGHISSTNNWRVYYNPKTQKFYPIMWDPGAFLEAYSEKYKGSAAVLNSTLINKLHRNEEFLTLKKKYLIEFNTSIRPKAIALVKEQTKDIVKKIEDSFLPYHQDAYMDLYSKAEIIDINKGFPKLVEDTFNEVLGYYQVLKVLPR